MNISKELNKISLPAQYKRNGVDCFLDPYRKRLIERTPEENVRQKVAAYFENVLNVPHDMIRLEVPMERYLEGTSGRADIIVHAPVDADLMRALAVIECKKPEVRLTDHVINQAIQYADITLSEYFFVTNGSEILAFMIDESSREYVRLSEIPSYETMLGGHGNIQVGNAEEYIRFTLSQMKDINLLDDYNNAGEWIYGSGTPNSYKAPIINLYQGLMDSNIQLPKRKCSSFQLIDDLGIRYLDYSNGGGGHYYGNYRSFLIEDAKGNAQIYSISLFGTDSDFRADKGEHRNSYAVLFVAVDRFKTSKPVLQLNLDTYLKKKEDGFHIVHDGRISGLHSDELRDFVGKKSPGLMNKDGMIELGILPADRLINMESDSDLIYHIIEYATIRDEYRQKTKNK